MRTERITGAVDGPRILLQPGSDPQAEYVGTVEGDTMELENRLVPWEGQAATFEDFGEAAEEMAHASRKGGFQDQA